MACPLELKISEALPKCTFKQLKQIHALIIQISLNQNIQLFSNFLRRSTEFGSMDYSTRVFSHIDHAFSSETLLFNAMIRGYAFNGPNESCISLYDEMLQRGVKPHNFTYPYVLNSCSDLGWFRNGEKVHCRIIKTGFNSSFAVANSLLCLYIKMSTSFCLDVSTNMKLRDARKVFDDMSIRSVEVWNRMISEYVSIGDVGSARRLFDEMPERDTVTWNSMVSGYVKVGEVANARNLLEQMPVKNVVSWTSMIRAYSNAGDLLTARKFFQKMPERNVVSWNSMIFSCTQNEEFEEALDLFVQMQSEGVVPDGYTFVPVLLACSHLGALEFGKWIHYLIEDWSNLGVIAGTALIDMYSNCGDINKAFILFIKIGLKDIFCWNVMIKSLAIHGKAEDAIKLFSLMRKKGLKLNDFTFIGALFACSHGGLVEEGRKIFYNMEKEYGVSPKIEHFCCVIDLLSRNGRLEEALVVVKRMPFEPDIAIWGALLGGCRVKSDLKRAEEVVERASELKANESGIHVMLSNMYASVEQWPGALSARQKMEDEKIMKKSGHSRVVYDVHTGSSEISAECQKVGDQSWRIEDAKS